MAQSRRGVFLTICAVGLALMAISNFSKPLEYGKITGFVFFGTRLHGLPNLIVGPIFGAFLAVYAFGIWRMRRFALPMGVGYAVYVILNLILFNATHARPPDQPALFWPIYIAIAVGISSGAALFLYRRRADLT